MANSTVFNSTKKVMELGGIEYLMLHFVDYFPYTFLAVFSFSVGIIGNFFIMGAILLTKELQTVSNMIVFNIAIADLMISGIVDSFTAVGVLWGKRFFDDRPGLCTFVAAACLIFCETSLMSIGFLAFNRYIKICHTNYYNKFFTKKLTLLYCAICWLIGFLIDIPNFAGWGGHVYDKQTLNCLWDRLASHSYSIFFPLSSIVMPCIVIAFFYIRIFLFAFKSKSKIQVSKSHKLKHTLRVAKGLFASYMLFVLCWLPYGLACMIDFQNNWPRTVHMYTMLLAHMNSSLNPVLYALSNPLFQRGYLNLLKKLFCFKKTNIKVNHSTKNNTVINHISLTDSHEHFKGFSVH